MIFSVKEVSAFPAGRLISERYSEMRGKAG